MAKASSAKRTSSGRKKVTRQAAGPPVLYELGAMGLGSSTNVRISLRGSNLDDDIGADNVRVRHGGPLEVLNANVVKVLGIQVLMVVTKPIERGRKGKASFTSDEVTVTVTNPSSGLTSDPPIAIPVVNP